MRGVLLGSAASTGLLLSAAAEFTTFDAFDLALVLVLLVLQLFNLGKLFQIQKESTAVAALHQVAELGKLYHRLHERIEGHDRRLQDLEQTTSEIMMRLGSIVHLETAMRQEQAATRQAIAGFQKELSSIAQQAGLIPGV